MASGQYPFGIDDAKVTGWSGNDVGSAKVDVLGVTAMSVSVDSTTVEHRGDNQQLVSRKSGKTATGSMAQAAHQAEAMAVVGDGVTTTSGTTPSVVVSYVEPAVAIGTPYQIEAQASDGEGAARITVPKAVTSSGPSLDWAIEAFSNPGWDYDAQATDIDGVQGFYRLDQFETEEPIT